MGLTIIPIDDRTEARVKDNVATQDGWQLWVSLIQGDEYLGGDAVDVADLEDATIEAAARGYAAGRLSEADDG